MSDRRYSGYTPRRPLEQRSYRLSVAAGYRVSGVLGVILVLCSALPLVLPDRAADRRGGLATAFSAR